MLLAKIGRNKRETITVLLLIALAVGFWSGSRYPQLNEKAIMGGNTQTEDPLTFNAEIVIQEGDSLAKRVGISALNWASENKKGMTFGFLLGACFLTLFSLFERRGTQNAFLNSLIGVGTGAPLGVCVNCAAPIARGLHTSGARLETTLSAMFASPTMNVVVVTMLFSIFPPFLVFIKLGMTLFFLLIVIPILSRTAFREETMQTYDDDICPVGRQVIPPADTWLEAGRVIGFAYVKNIWYIVKMTLPLMILAGFLAALVIHLIPLESVLELEVAPLSILAVTLFGIFLPLPIALDVVLSATLLAAGFPMIYVAILLFTLGIYSVYSFSIIWSSVSGRVATVLAIVLMALGIVAGLVAEGIHQHELKVMLETLEELS